MSSELGVNPGRGAFICKKTRDPPACRKIFGWSLRRRRRFGAVPLCGRGRKKEKTLPRRLRSVFTDFPDRWSDKDPVSTIDKVCDLGRKELAAWMHAWFGDLEIMHEDLSDDFNDKDLDNLRQRTDVLRRIMLILDFKADVAEELVSSLGRTKERLATVEREVADLRTQLRTVNAEIAELRAVNSDSNGLTPVDATEGEPLDSNNGGATVEAWSAVVGRRARKGPGSKVRFSRPQRIPPASTPGGGESAGRGLCARSGARAQIPGDSD